MAEFDGLVEVLPATTVKPLRRMLMWIEWDRIDESDRRTLAKYYGGRLWNLANGEHPLKSNSIELLSLKTLQKEKELSPDRTRLVMLHELAHAVHHQVLGFENLDIKFAYRQAMDRRLYDRVKHRRGDLVTAYAAVNPNEYFAELTCAYLDRCDYFPFTREDLKEHDPTGFQLMEATWGKEVARSDKLKNKQKQKQ